MEAMEGARPVGAFVFASVPKSVSVREGALMRLATHIKDGLIVGQSVGQVVAAIKAEANALDIDSKFARVEMEPEKAEAPPSPPYRMYGSQGMYDGVETERVRLMRVLGWIVLPIAALFIAVALIGRAHAQDEYGFAAYSTEYEQCAWADNETGRRYAPDTLTAAGAGRSPNRPHRV